VELTIVSGIDQVTTISFAIPQNWVKLLLKPSI
jgi:hypothetical protein